MKILDLKVMRGPNIWSNYRQKLIVMRLDLEDLEQNPTHHIDGFGDRLKKLMPSLYGHRCSEGNKGGFFQRVEQGTWMGHVVEHIALELQTLAGMDCGYGRTRSTDKEGVYNVVFAYRVEEAGLYAANAAVEIALALVKGKEYDIGKDIRELAEIARRRKLPGHTNVVIDEAHRAEIPFFLVNDSLLILGYGINQVKMRGTLAGTSSSIALEIAENKTDTKNLLSAAQVPVAQGMRIYDEEDLEAAFNRIEAPIVIKPAQGYHGRKVAFPLYNTEQALPFFQQVNSTYGRVMAEKAMAGDLYRILFIDFKLVSVIRYKRTEMTGDGRSTIKALVSHHAPGLDAGKGIMYDMVPANGQLMWLEGQPEIFEGEISPLSRALFERVAKLSDLNVCCVDMIAPGNDESLDAAETNIVSIEGRPDLTDFMEPAAGYGKNVIRPLFEMLFSKNNKARIPLVAVRGNGESATIAHLLAHICDSAGKKTGIAGGNDIRINGHVLCADTCEGDEAVRGVLFDPGIDTAIVECKSQDILASGLAFDTSEISIITGSRAKKSRRNKEQSRTEKECDLVVGRTTPSWGHLILNIDNDCDYLGDDLYGEIVLYTTDPSHSALRRHFEKGRLAAFVEDNTLVIQKGKWKTPLLSLTRLSFGDEIDAAAFVLPAILAAYLLKIDTKMINGALTSFKLPAKVLEAEV